MSRAITASPAARSSNKPVQRPEAAIRDKPVFGHAQMFKIFEVPLRPPSHCHPRLASLLLQQNALNGVTLSFTADLLGYLSSRLASFAMARSTLNLLRTIQVRLRLDPYDCALSSTGPCGHLWIVRGGSERQQPTISLTTTCLSVFVPLNLRDRQPDPLIVQEAHKKSTMTYSKSLFERSICTFLGIALACTLMPEERLNRLLGRTPKTELDERQESYEKPGAFISTCS